MISRILKKHNILYFYGMKKRNNDKQKLYFKDFLQASSEINLGANGEL